VQLKFDDQPKYYCRNPENAIVKQKMVYTSSKDYIKKALEIAIELQANDSDDISEDNIVEKWVILMAHFSGHSATQWPNYVGPGLSWGSSGLGKLQADQIKE